MKVMEIMSRSVHTCAPHEPLSRAAQIMWEHDCGCVPVVDPDGRVIAMVTDRDACMAAYTQGRPLAEIPVSSAASHSVVRVRETDSLGAAEAIMRNHQVRRLPVVDEADRPIGIISINDLARHSRPVPKGSDGITPENVVRTLAAICEPPRQAQAAE